MSDDKGIVFRPSPSWPPILAMLVAMAATWLTGWGLLAACVVGVVANLVVTMSMPRRFGRWTE